MIDKHTKNTLNHWSKKDLVEHCICLEHNNKSLRESFEIQYQNCMKMIENMNLLNKRFKNVTRDTTKR